jgi:hypothetical protein
VFSFVCLFLSPSEDSDSESASSSNSESVVFPLRVDSQLEDISVGDVQANSVSVLILNFELFDLEWFVSQMFDS